VSRGEGTRQINAVTSTITTYFSQYVKELFLVLLPGVVDVKVTNLTDLIVYTLKLKELVIRFRL